MAESCSGNLGNKHKQVQTRKHFSRMDTAHLLTISHSIPCISGVSQTPSMDADPPSDANSLPGHVTCDACWDPMHARQNDRHV